MFVLELVTVLTIDMTDLLQYPELAIRNQSRELWTELEFS